MRRASSIPPRPVTGFLPDVRMPGGRAPTGSQNLPVVHIPPRPPPPIAPIVPIVLEEPPATPARAPTHGSERTLKHERLPVPVAVDRTIRVATILGVFALGAAGLAQPTSVLRGGISWLAFLFFVLSGWGTWVALAVRSHEPEPGQRIALGLAGVTAIAGPLVMLGLFSRPVVLLVICAGFGGFAWREATGKVALWRRVRHGVLYVRARPALGAFVAAVIALACVRMIGAVAALDRNPWDDDLGYTPLIKRLLDTGSLREPFSVHRLAAYGGQTVLGALAGARGTLANVHLIDKALGLGALLLVTIGLARERRAQLVWLAMIALVIVLLPDTAVSTASMWIAAAGFVALYRAVVREHWMFAGVLAAGLCTLRQSTVIPVVAFLAIVLGGKLVARMRLMPWREAWRDERWVWLRTFGLAAALLVPWWIAALVSSRTFLFPLVDGTWNHALGLTPPVTPSQQLAYLVAGCLETAPLVVIPLLALALAFVSDHRSGRPLAALAAAAALGFVALVPALVGSDSFTLWRHAFGFAAALTVVMTLELGADDDGAVELAPLGRWIVLGALVLQVALGRGALTRQAVRLFDDVSRAAAIDRLGDPGARAEQRRYAAMQAQVPAGAAIAVMVDEPALLDYRRNPIANLDTPGYASPGAQLPAFAGAEPLRAYLVAQGYRYAAFVRSERSRYFFRRPFWLWRLFSDREALQITAAYAIDAIDGFTELATTVGKRYDSDGLVVLDLGAPARPATTYPVGGDEPIRRGAWTRVLADREGLHDAWSLTTRADLRFEDGAGTLTFVDGSVDDPRWFDAVHPREPATRGTAVLPVSRRVHLRVRGVTDMRLSLRAAIALNSVFTHPRLDLSLDGDLLTSAVADGHGRYAIDAVVPRAKLAGAWHDLYLIFSSVSEPGREPSDAPVARLESVEWSP